MRFTLNVSTLVGLLTLVLTHSCFAQPATYRVRHDYRVNLRDNELLRGQWKYVLKSKAISRAGRAYERDSDVVGPFTAATTANESITATSGALATATSNARLSFRQNGGFHQVDGSANAIGNGRFARAFSSSALALNAGVRRANGRVRWKPNWQIDRIRGSSRAGRDPVEIVVMDQETGQLVRDTLFDLQVDLGEGGSGSWEDGQLKLNGIDGTFRVEIGGKYLTSQRGSMRLEYDEHGIVTRSYDSGVFAGLLPAVGQPATLDLNVNQYIGDSDGNIDLDFDFGMTGNLDLTTNLGGDGIANAWNDQGHGITLQDFSHVSVWDNPKVLFGTDFVSNQHLAPAAMIVADDELDPYSGHLVLGGNPDQPLNMIAFDASADHTGRTLHGVFDFHLGSSGEDGMAAADGLSFLLLPTSLYGEAGWDATVEQELLAPQFSAQSPAALGALGLGLRTLGDGPDQQTMATLTWDGETVAQAPVLHASAQDWQQARMDIQSQEMGTVVSIAIGGPDEEGPTWIMRPTLLNGIFLEGGFRPAFATRSAPGAGLHAIDNLFFDYGLAMLGDFNQNEMFDVEDIDLLTQHVAAGEFVPEFDLNGDQQVDQLDFVEWIDALAMIPRGDANVDGSFDTSDLVKVFQAGRYETGEMATWSEGDWNADGVFSTADLIVAFAQGGFETPLPSATATASNVSIVPEPTSITAVAFTMLGLATVRRRYAK